MKTPDSRAFEKIYSQISNKNCRQWLIQAGLYTDSVFTKDEDNPIVRAAIQDNVKANSFYSNYYIRGVPLRRRLFYNHRSGNYLGGRFPVGLQGLRGVEAELNHFAVLDGEPHIIEYFLIDGVGDEFEVAHHMTFGAQGPIGEKMKVDVVLFQFLAQTRCVVVKLAFV